jgi:hypothetical protein
MVFQANGAVERLPEVTGWPFRLQNVSQPSMLGSVNGTLKVELVAELEPVTEASATGAVADNAPRVSAVRVTAARARRAKRFMR